MNEGFMKKANRKTKDDLRPEYDFANMKGGVRGKYATQTRSRTNLVLLDPEIAKAFPTDASVNQVTAGRARSRVPCPHIKPSGTPFLQA